MKKGIGNGRTLAVLLLFVVSLASAVPTAIAPADARRYLNDIKTLTQPNMEGRGDGSKGLIRAEHVIQVGLRVFLWLVRGSTYREKT